MSAQFRIAGLKNLKVLWEDAERVLCRGFEGDSAEHTVLVVMPVGERSTSAGLPRLHEYKLKDVLDAAWAARPLELRRDGERTLLLLKDPGGEPLSRRIGAPMDVGRFLPLSIGIAAAIGKAHRSGLVHKDVKPANILVDCADGGVRFTGFGVASRLPRQRQAPDPPGIIAGTLAYMAPEQTGRLRHVWTAPADQGLFSALRRSWVRSCLRPFARRIESAGPDVVR